MHLSSLGQGGWQATEREEVFRCIGKLEQCLRDLLRQSRKSWTVVQVCVLWLDLLPESLKRVRVRRIGGQLEDLPPGCLLGAAGLGRGAGVRPRPSLPEDERVRGLRQQPLEPGHGRGGVEAAFLALIKEASRKGLNQPADLVALTLAGGLALRWLAAPCPGGGGGAPRREARFSPKQEQGVACWRAAQHLGPGLGPPLLPLACMEMIRDAGRLLRAAA